MKPSRRAVRGFRPLGLTGAIVLAMSVGLMISASSAAAGAGEYISGWSPHWVKANNRQHPAFNRVMDQFG